MIWLGKFYSDFVWAAWPSVNEQGFKAILKFWTVVDCLNLVYSHFCNFSAFHFLRPFEIFVMLKPDLDDRFYRLPPSICFICFKQPLESANKSVFQHVFRLISINFSSHRQISGCHRRRGSLESQSSLVTASTFFFLSHCFNNSQSFLLQHRCSTRQIFQVLPLSRTT